MTPKAGNMRSAVRKASADALERELRSDDPEASASIDGLHDWMVKYGAWTRKQLETAIDDLVADGRAELLPGNHRDGYIRIRLVSGRQPESKVLPTAPENERCPESASNGSCRTQTLPLETPKRQTS